MEILEIPANDLYHFSNFPECYEITIFYPNPPTPESVKAKYKKCTSYLVQAPRVSVCAPLIHLKAHFHLLSRGFVAISPRNDTHKWPRTGPSR